MVTRGYQKFIDEQPKLFKRGNIIFGISGFTKLKNTLRFMDIPDKPDGMDAYEYLCTTFTQALRAAEANMTDCQILIAMEGRLFVMYFDMAVTEFNRYGAIGSGEDFALGAIEAMLNLGLGDVYDPEFILMRAMEAAGKWCNSVGEPYYVIK